MASAPAKYLFTPGNTICSQSIWTHGLATISLDNHLHRGNSGVGDLPIDRWGTGNDVGDAGDLTFYLQMCDGPNQLVSRANRS
jgi:hypothetical protein